jgi:shikimate dehydrogenase
MMYGAQPTPFMRQAHQDGAARTSDGLGMLVSQAAESFWIWNGVRPEVDPVLHQIRQELAQSLTKTGH